MAVVAGKLGTGLRHQYSSMIHISSMPLANILGNSNIDVTRVINEDGFVGNQLTQVNCNAPAGAPHGRQTAAWR